MAFVFHNFTAQNFLNNYNQHVITTSDYVKSLRLYAQQHYLPNGELDLVENYDPNLGGPIVYYYWSNHYNHSSFNNLIITGLCGIRPSAGDTLVINPLVDNSIQYFCLDGVSYHGHTLTIVYDKDGSRYNFGKGVTILIDGKKATLLQEESKTKVVVGTPVKNYSSHPEKDYALNITRKGYPVPSASVNSVPDTSLYQAIDGRIWYFTEITNRWTTFGSTVSSDWYALDFGQTHNISGIKIYLVTDDETFGIPDDIVIEYRSDGKWLPVKPKAQAPVKFIGNTVNEIVFDEVTASTIRIQFKHTTKQVAVSEIECY